MILLFRWRFRVGSRIRRQLWLFRAHGNLFQTLGDAPTPLPIVVICLSVTFLTELTSNVATLSMFANTGELGCELADPSLALRYTGDDFGIHGIHDARGNSTKRGGFREPENRASQKWPEPESS